MKAVVAAFIVAMAVEVAWAADSTCLRTTAGEDLTAVLDRVPRRGCVQLAPGVYDGSLILKKAVTLRGELGAVIRGGDRAVTIAASRVRLENLTIEGEGRVLSEHHAAVFLNKFTHHVTLKNVTLKSPAYGVFGEGVGTVTMEASRVIGDQNRPMTSRGDGFYMKSSQGVIVKNSEFEHVRDGVYFESTEGCLAEGNRFSDAQYGVHFMYTKNDEARGNFVTASAGGVAVMSTRRATVVDNRVTSGTEFGILLNVADGCTVKNNTLTDIHNPDGDMSVNSEGKALFIYGAGANLIAYNRFEKSDIGADVALGGEGSRVFGNSFTGNMVPVRYVGKKPLTWTEGSVGNFWGESVVWDLDGDGVGDLPYQPNDSLDRLFWLYPEARFLAESPVVFLLRRLTAGLALDAGKGITDTRPLVKRPVQAGAAGGAL